MYEHLLWLGGGVVFFFCLFFFFFECGSSAEFTGRTLCGFVLGVAFRSQHSMQTRQMTLKIAQWLSLCTLKDRPLNLNPLHAWHAANTMNIFIYCYRYVMCLSVIWIWSLFELLFFKCLNIPVVRVRDGQIQHFSSLKLLRSSVIPNHKGALSLLDKFGSCRAA